MPAVHLKRHIFNHKLVARLGLIILKHYPQFKFDDFKVYIGSFHDYISFSERLNIITNALNKYMPKDFYESAKIIKKSLPEDYKTDNNWNQFIWMPLSDFIAKNGCKKEYLEVSFALIEDITKHFTCEFAIRPFIENFEEESINQLTIWATNKNPNVRRLASEGCRPRLPWAKEIKAFKKNPYSGIELLQILKNDDSKYVQKSVANHMNDIAKDNPKIALKILRQWKKENKPNTNWIVKHALRNELKKGTPDALKIEGYSLSPKIKISNFLLSHKKIKIGDSLKFSFTITNTGPITENLLIDYICFFMKFNNKRAPKTFKIGVKKVKKGESVLIEKTHSFKLISTRKLYSGEHKIAVFINGKIICEKSFELDA